MPKEKLLHSFRLQFQRPIRKNGSLPVRKLSPRYRRLICIETRQPGWGSDNQWNDWLLHGSTITDIKGKARATQKLRETKRIRYSRNELLLLDPHNYSRIGEEAAALINKSKTSNYHQHRTPHVRYVDFCRHTH